VAAQIGLSVTRPDLLGLVLPAIGLAIVAAALSLRPGSAVRSSRPKRALLARITLGFALCFGLSFLVDDPRSALMMQLSQMVMINVACVRLGRLFASLFVWSKPALG
jgi:hypothetical protein